MTITTIIFDWDGTLARTLHLWVDGYHSAFARRELHFPAETIVAEFFQDHHLVPGRHPHLDFGPIADEARAHVFEAAIAVSLYDGALDMLRDLTRQGLRLGLVSSSPRRLLERGMQAHGVAGFFGSIVAGDDGFGHKPDPLPFAETMARCNLAGRETLIIGDSHVDILAGKAAGCRTCWFAPPENQLFHDHSRHVARQADHHVSHLEGLRAHL